ncbi:hypothetical protein YC2023_108011 [Brassica napus]
MPERGEARGNSGPLERQSRSVAGCDAPVQQERGVCLELTTPKKLRNVLSKEQRE